MNLGVLPVIRHRSDTSTQSNVSPRHSQTVSGYAELSLSNAVANTLVKTCPLRLLTQIPQPSEHTPESGT